MRLLCPRYNQHGDNNERGKHQEICDLTGAAGLGLGQMNNVLDADHRDRRSDAEDKRADEHDRAGQIHLEKRRHERNLDGSKYISTVAIAAKIAV